MSALDIFNQMEMTSADWAFILSEKFSDEVTADILGLSVEVVAQKRGAAK